MKRAVTRPPSPHTSRQRLLAGRFDALVEGGEAIPRDRRLERLREHADRDEHVAHVGGAEERLAPGADGVCPAAVGSPRRRRRAARLGHDAAVLGADLERPRERVVDRMVGRLEAEHEQRVAAVAGHRHRRLARVDQAAVGRVEPGLRERAHALRAGGEVGKRTPAERLCSGRGCTRTQASVIRPSVPSEPASMRSGLGPAPEPGSLRDCHTPAGVIARADSTKSSMCVRPVAKCPAARVAIQPPSVEYSKRLREVAQRQPVLAELAPRAPARSRRPGSARRARRRRPRARGRARAGRS